MKKIILLSTILFSTLQVAAQKENEVKLNLFNTLVISSVEVGYERFIDDHQSLEANLFINDRFSYYLPFNSKKKFHATSVSLGYNYYIGDGDNNANSGIVISPFMKLRLGNYSVKQDDGSKEKTNLDSFILGIGGGYKWVFNDVFTIHAFGNIARNFSSSVNDKFISLEPNAGISLGYRF